VRLLAALVLLALACGGQSADTNAAPERPRADSIQPGPAAADTARTGPALPPASLPAGSPETKAAPPATREERDDKARAALSEAQRATLLAGPEDPPIPVEIHYVQSNETRHDLFFPYIAGKGGAYVGIGSDPNYTMMAASGCDLAFLMDIDYRVVDLHRIYEVLLPRSETPRDLIDFFAAEAKADTMALLDEAFANLEHAERRRVVRGYKVGRETVRKHLERVVSRHRDGRPTSWLSDPEMYAQVRALFREGRVRIMSGDLTGTASLKSVAKAARMLDVPVLLLYVSNAEEYFKYTRQFAANIEALPITEDSVILRTIYSKEWEHADLWAYQVQPLSDMKKRLRNRQNRSRRPMLRLAERDGTLQRDTGRKGLSLVGKPSVLGAGSDDK
jgi:hypothetical protein